MTLTLISGFENDLKLQHGNQTPIVPAPLIELPCDGIRIKSNRQPRTHSISLPCELLLLLNSSCQKINFSCENVLLAIFKVLLHRYTDETQIQIYGNFSNQDPSLLHLLPLTEVSATQTGRQVCRSIQQKLFEANTHTEIVDGFIDEIEKLSSQCDSEALETNPPALIEFGIRSESLMSRNDQPDHSDTASQRLADRDLVFTIGIGKTDWQVDLIYDSTLFLPETIARLVEHYKCLLTGFLNSPDIPIQDLPILNVAERQELLVTWNQNAYSFVPDRCIHQYIEEQVEKTPHAIALIFTDKDNNSYQLTYRELNEKANQLGHYLRSHGIGPKNSQTTPVVSVYFDRSPEMMIAFLGVLKAGAAYLPLDPLYPHERRVHKIKDSETVFLLTQESLMDSLGPDDFSGTIMCLDRDWDVIEKQPKSNLCNLSTPDSLAYIIYTSGSTGNPKGVMIPHKALVNHCFAMREEFALQSNERVLQFSSMSFDLIVAELYPTLVTGATLVLRSDGISSSITQFLQFIETYKINVLALPTAFWHGLVRGIDQINRKFPDSVRLVFVGGEKASKSIYKQWCGLVSPHVRWLNIYGPTETTVNATLYDPAAEGFQWEQGEILIGRHINNVKTYILDHHLNPVPIGIPGELYIGGLGVAKGYLNQPEETAEKFIKNPFDQDSTDQIYRTGDIVRYRINGAIEFVGRRDFQVKIRGFRIELGEIERALESYPEVQQAVVLAIESNTGQKNLAAYYVLKSSVNSTDLRAFLLTKLPDYMVPIYFMVMPILPLTPNGKIDRKALPDPQTAVSNNDIQGPSDVIETELLEIWQKLLGVNHLNVTDSFFDLGGHSLLIAEMLTEIGVRWERALPINILFEAPTIQKLAVFLRSSDIVHQTIIPFRIQGSKPTIFCIPGAGGNLRFAHRFVQEWGDRDHPIYGVQEPIEHHLKSIGMSIPAVAAYYIQQIQIIQPHGPYHLVGYSIGGLFAYEMAQQLRSQGHEVALLGLLDPVPPLSAIRSRRIVQRLGKLNGFSHNVLKLLRFKDGCVTRVQAVPYHRFPSAIFQEIQDFWFRIYRKTKSKIGEIGKFLKIYPIETSNVTTSLDMNSIQNHTQNNSYYFDYNDAVLCYLPTIYKGSVKLFYSQEWNATSLIKRSWERWFKGEVDLHIIDGDHLNFYQENAAEIISQLLP